MLEFFVMLSESKPEVLLTKLDMMLLQSNKVCFLISDLWIITHCVLQVTYRL